MGKAEEEGLISCSLRISKSGARRTSSKQSSTPIHTTQALVRLLHAILTCDKPTAESSSIVGLGLLFMLNVEKSEGVLGRGKGGQRTSRLSIFPCDEPEKRYR